MYEVEVTIKGVTSYGANAMIPDDAPDDVKKKPSDETWETYMRRVLPYTIHTNKSGHLIIPANALSECIKYAAKFAGEKVPGRGQMTFGTIFKSGIAVRSGIALPYTVKELNERLEPQSVDSHGKKGGSSRVTRYFWWVEEWGGTFQLTVLNGLITKKVFERTLVDGGLYTGLGMYRPQNGGEHGLFKVTNFKYSGEVVEE